MRFWQVKGKIVLVVCSSNITNYMEQSPSWEANRSSTSQEIPDILWNPNIHYRIHKSPSPFPILSQIDPVHAPHSTSRRSILILSSHLHLDLSSGHLPSGFPTKTLYAPLLFRIYCYIPCPSHYSWFDREAQTTLLTERGLMSVFCPRISIYVSWQRISAFIRNSFT